jgi:hypothetical protein
LLKCDIEGSELSFLKNYKDLLYRVKKAVFEFHPTYCDKSQCFDILREAGFTNNKILKKHLHILFTSSGSKTKQKPLIWEQIQPSK